MTAVSNIADRVLRGTATFTRHDAGILLDEIADLRAQLAEATKESARMRDSMGFTGVWYDKLRTLQRELAEATRAREQAEQGLENATNTLMRLFTAQSCEEHQRRAQTQSPTEFAAEQEALGCPYCARTRAERAEAAYVEMEKADVWMERAEQAERRLTLSFKNG